jgi:hypothetical protein
LIGGLLVAMELHLGLYLQSSKAVVNALSTEQKAHNQSIDHIASEGGVLDNGQSSGMVDVIAYRGDVVQGQVGSYALL